MVGEASWYSPLETLLAINVLGCLSWQDFIPPESLEKLVSLLKYMIKNYEEIFEVRGILG